MSHFSHGHTNFADVRFDLGGTIKVSVPKKQTQKISLEKTFLFCREDDVVVILVKISQTDIQIRKTGVQLTFIGPDVQLLD